MRIENSLLVKKSWTFDIIRCIIRKYQINCGDNAKGEWVCV